MMTKLIISVFLFFSFISTCLLGQNGTDTSNVQTVLFQITSSTSDKTSYLFGTHHAFGKAFFDSLTKANQALNSCDLLIKENLNIPGHTAEDIINRRATMTPWKKYLSKEDMSFIADLFATSPTDYHKMTPVEMYVFLNRHFKQQICLHKNPRDTSLSLDDYIASVASAQNIELYGLETTAEQLDLIHRDVDGMPRRSHQRRLANIIDKIRTQNVNDCAETDWYSQMEIDYQMHAPCRNTLVLTDRNDRWIQTITGFLENRNCFIAVGLSHLMYACGLIRQLTELGYTVTPMPVR